MARRGREGGKKRMYPGVGEVEPPDSFADVRDLLSRVMAALLEGEIKPKVANAASRLARSWKDAHEGELATGKIEKIEEKLSELDTIRKKKPWERG